MKNNGLFVVNCLLLAVAVFSLLGGYFFAGLLLLAILALGVLIASGEISFDEPKKEPEPEKVCPPFRGKILSRPDDLSSVANLEIALTRYYEAVQKLEKELGLSYGELAPLESAEAMDLLDMRYRVSVLMGLLQFGVVYTGFLYVLARDWDEFSHEQFICSAKNVEIDLALATSFAEGE